MSCQEYKISILSGGFASLAGCTPPSNGPGHIVVRGHSYFFPAPPRAMSPPGNSRCAVRCLTGRDYSPARGPYAPGGPGGRSCLAASPIPHDRPWLAYDGQGRLVIRPCAASRGRACLRPSSLGSFVSAASACTGPRGRLASFSHGGPLACVTLRARLLRPWMAPPLLPESPGACFWGTARACTWMRQGRGIVPPQCVHPPHTGSSALSTYAVPPRYTRRPPVGGPHPPGVARSRARRRIQEPKP